MPGGELTDRRGERWSVEGDLELLGLTVEDGVLVSATYPDALGRVWSALRCRTAAEVLLSAKPGYEFVDWGGDHHVGGGSTAPARQRLARHAAVVRHGAGQRGREASGRCATSADGARALRRRARTARCTRTTHSARCCGAARGRTARTSSHSGRCATSCRWCGSTSAFRREGGAPRPPPARGPRAFGRRPAPAVAGPLRRAAAGLAHRAGRRPARGRRAARGAPGARRARADLRPRLLQEQGEAALAGVVLRPARAAGRAHDGALADRRRRPQRPRARELDGLQGRVDDGARLRRGVRADRQRAVDLAAAVRAVRAALRAAAAAAAAPRPRGAARVLGLLRVLRRLADRRVGPAGLSAAGVPARADADDRARARGARRSG